MEIIEEKELVLDQDEKEQEDKGVKVQLIVFKLAGEEYALPIDQIKEIVLTPRISEMPQTPEYVVGIANIRGDVISIMDFEKKFGLNNHHIGAEEINDNGKTNYTMVIESEEFNIGVLVNQVPNTLSISSSKIDSAENVMQHSSLDESVVKGVVRAKDRMIIMIDVHAMLGVGELKTKI
ncbi:MAG: chemotaxis protein CheW [Reichenbachiella sp.]